MLRHLNGFRPHRGILGALSLAPFRNRIGIDPVLGYQFAQARLTMLYRSQHCLCCPGESV